jgi:signal transduction histidine kinase
VRIEFLVQLDAQRNLRMIRLVTAPIRRKVVRVMVIWGILLALLLAMFVVLAPRATPLWLGLAVIVLITMVVPFQRLARVNRRAAAQLADYQFFAYAITDEEIGRQTALGSGSLRWLAITSVDTAPEFWVLRRGKAVAMVVHRQMSPEQETEFVGFLQNRGLLPWNSV